MGEGGLGTEAEAWGQGPFVAMRAELGQVRLASASDGPAYSSRRIPGLHLPSPAPTVAERDAGSLARLPSPLSTGPSAAGLPSPRQAPMIGDAFLLQLSLEPSGHGGVMWFAYL